MAQMKLRSPRREEEPMRSAAREPAGFPEPIKRFLVKINERYVVVRAVDVLWAESADNYVVLHTATANHVLRRTLSQLAQELDARVFFRASRSALVNLDAIREVHSVGAGHVLVLADGARVTLSRGLRELQVRLQGRE